MGYRVRRGEVFDTAYTANDDVFAAPIVPRYSGTFRVQVELSASGVLSVTGGGVTAGKLNQGVAVDADNIHWFDLEVSEGREYNFKIDATLTIKQFLVTERMDDGK